MRMNVYASPKTFVLQKLNSWKGDGPNYFKLPVKAEQEVRTVSGWTEAGHPRTEWMVTGYQTDIHSTWLQNTGFWYVVQEIRKDLELVGLD